MSTQPNEGTIVLGTDRDRDPLGLSLPGITIDRIMMVGMAGLLYALAWLVGRQWFDLGVMDLWQPKGNLPDALGDVWFIFVWAIAPNLILGAVLLYHRIPRTHSPLSILGRGTWVSLVSGIAEEITFRWLGLFVAITVIKLGNYVTFGLAHWIYIHWLIPFGNFVTFHALDPQLVGLGWLVGAAILVSNNWFEDSHTYQGWFGQINSWFMGMVFFWVMFHYGLWTAIAVHILYDVAIFATCALVTVFQPQPSTNLLARRLVERMFD